MKKLLIVAVALIMVAGTAWAVEQDSPPAHVTVSVDAVLAVGAGSIMSADLGSMNIGTASATVCFRIDANQQDVWLQTIATDLWKGDVATADDFKIVIAGVNPPVAGAGALVQPAIGNQISLPTNILPWIANVATIGGLPAMTTTVGHFESGQWGHFSQEVCVTVDYENDNPELPQGEYSGWIKIVAGLASW